MRLPTHDDNYPSSPRNISKRTLAKSVLTTCLLHVFLKRHLLFFPLLPQPLLLFSCYPVQIFCDHMDCSTPGSSVHRILQARILEWIVTSFSRGSSQPMDGTCNLLHWQANSSPLSHLGSPFPSL